MYMDAKDPMNHENNARDSFVEAFTAEKKLWMLIRSKGPLSTDVQDLYHKTRSSYENAILHGDELGELRDIEQALWRLHYKHIDEFRNRIRTGSAGGDCTDLEVSKDIGIVQHDSDSILKGFRDFLSEASEFYQSLILKIQESYGFAKDVIIFKKCSFSNGNKGSKVQKGQFLCHRCLVCLGDLARYNELHTHSDVHNRNWSIVASHYLNASIIWPDSGNPHNQLAILAIYIGDELLALYHCIRSLAAKDPFLNAWENLILLFEKNRSSGLNSLSDEFTFNFCKPSERNVKPALPLYGNSKHTMPEPVEDAIKSDESCLWRLIVRMISFFYIKSSVDEFSCTFACTISELEALFSLDDVKLKAALESYQHMRVDTAMAGPRRVLQVVCVLIFSNHTLGENQNLLFTNNLDGVNQPVSLELALAATFIFMGRLVQRYAVANPVDCNLLLPAILVFVEWLAFCSGTKEKDTANEKYVHAVDYFFNAFVNLLNKFSCMEELHVEFVGDGKSEDHIALWEDYELRGFAPLALAQKKLNFSYDGNKQKGFEESDENHIRIYRILVAAITLAHLSDGSHKWICYDEAKRTFYTTELNTLDRANSETIETNVDIYGVEENRLHPFENSLSSGTVDGCGKPIHEEEDEVIVFKPIVRSNSSSLSAPIDANHGVIIDRLHDLSIVSSTSASLSIGKAQINYDDCSIFRSGSSCISVPLADDLPSTPSYDSGTSFCFPVQTMQGSNFGISENRSDDLAGPPSLSAWRLPREFSGIVENQGIHKSSTSSRGRVKDIDSGYMSNLSINGVTKSQQDTKIPPSMTHHEYSHLSKRDQTSTGTAYLSATAQYLASPYLVGPLPSAPLLPEEDDALCGGRPASSSTNYEYPYHLRHNASVLGEQLSEDQKGVANFVSASSRASDYLKLIRSQGLSAYSSGLPGYSKDNALFPSGVQSGMWPHLHRDNLHQGRSPDLGWPHLGPTHSSPYFGRFQDFDVLRPVAYDRWGQPLHLVYGADEERNKFLHGNYQMSNPYYGYGLVDQMSEQQTLLKYLKEQEWRLQQQQQ